MSLAHQVILVGLFFAALSSPLFGQELNQKEKAIERLLSERESIEAMDSAIDEARNLGIAEQVILEARFLFHVDRAEDAKIAQMLPEIRIQKEKFNLRDSEIFATKDDWLAVTEYVEAIAALEQGERDEFKSHITEAFWLSPKQGAAFAPHIDRIRLMDAMTIVTIDQNREFRPLFDVQALTIAGQLKGKSGLLFYFWSPRSTECEATMPDFLSTAKYLESESISVISILPETRRQIAAEAKELLGKYQSELQGKWVIDSKDDALADRLQVVNVPIFVLLDQNGKIRFNGHPTDLGFWEALKMIDPSTKRPSTN